MPTFSSFNAYGSESNEIGQSHIPVWLGFPGAVPVGGNLASAYLRKGLLLKAGTPVELKNKVITPLVAWEVVSFSAAAGSETVDTVVVRPAVLGGVEIAPAEGDKIQKVGATFAATGKAAAVVSATLITESTNKGCYTVTVATGSLDTPSAGDALTISAAESAGNSKSIKVQPNGYLYNDIYLGNLDDSDAAVSAKTIAATGAVIMYHNDGLLVELTPAAPVKEQMKAAVPGVLQVLV